MRNENRANRWYFGGVSSAAVVCLTHPLDLVKVHLQTQQLPNRTIFETVRHVYDVVGLKGLYRGMSASLLRQLTYTTARFGIYESGKQYISGDSVGQKLSLAAFAGLCGSFVGIPCDLVNVRMQNDSKLPREKQRRYKHVFHGLYRISKEEGVLSLFCGGSPAVLRGVTMTIAQNVVYDYMKRTLLKSKNFKDNSLTHFFTSLITGGVGTLLTQPLDVMKTRLMNAKPGQYAGLLAVVKDIAAVGPSGFYKGLIPAFARIGPHTILTFLLMEQLRLYYGRLPTADKRRIH